MQQSSRRWARLIGTALAAMSVAVLPGCASNFGSPVMQHYDPAGGINHREGDIYALDVLVVADDSGNGTLAVGLVNKTQRGDRLVSVEAAADDITVSSPSAVVLPPENLVQLADDASVSLSGEGLRPGHVVPVTLRFARASQIQAQVPVVENEDAYADVPIEEPTETAEDSSGQ